jgi:hypothetical protein
MGMIYCDVLQYKLPIHGQSHTVNKVQILSKSTAIDTLCHIFWSQITTPSNTAFTPL